MTVPSHETWRAVEGWPYEVSDHGNVRHIDRRGHMLMPWRMPKEGYLQVNLCMNGGCTKYLIHRLICAAFHGKQPEGKFDVDHINSVRRDNRASNLRWLSTMENRRRQGIDHHNARLTDEIVREIRLDGRISMDAVFAARFGVLPFAISQARRGKTWRHVK